MKKEALILIAGMGTRLKPLTLKTHKCLTEVNGTPILENALQILKECGVSRVTLVVGYLQDQIQSRIGTDYQGMQIRYVVNNDFNTTSTSYSLCLGLDSLESYTQLYVLEGDVFFEKNLLDSLMDMPEENATALEPYRPELDGSFVELDEEKYVVDWVHKNSRPDNFVVQSKFKTVNIHKFSSSFVTLNLLPALRSSVSSCKGKESLEDVMMRLVRKNRRAIKGLVLNGQKWFEVDDLHDLKIAEKMFQK